MTSYEFMRRCINGDQTRPRTVASIYWDGRTVYSYGTHYPLLLNICGKWIRNDRGYSSTTGKHTSWAGSLCDYTMRIPRMDGWSDQALTPEKLLDYATEEIEKQKVELKAVSPRAFRKAEDIQNRIDQLEKTAAFLMRCIEGYQTE